MKKPTLLLLGLDGVPGSYIRSEVKKGRLKGFGKMMKEGVFFDDMQSSFPTITPSCWNTVYTCAVPKVHGGACELIHYDGKAPWEFSTSYGTENIRAEKFWEAARRAGKRTLLIDAMGAGRKDDPFVTHVVDDVTVDPDKATADSKSNGAPWQHFSVKEENGETSYYLGIIPPSAEGEWNRISDGDAVVRKTGAGAFTFEAIKNADITERFFWTVLTDKDGVRVGCDEKNAKKAEPLKPGGWSSVMTRELMTDLGERGLFHFRAYLESDGNGGTPTTVMITAARNLLMEISPIEKARRIQKIPEIHTVYWGADFETNPDKCLDTVEFRLEWKKQVLLDAVEEGENDILFVYDGVNDAVNHSDMSAFCGIKETKSIDKKRAERDFARGYSIIDNFILWLYDNIVGEDTTFALFADHGGVGISNICNFMKVLKDAGLTVYTTEDESKISWRNDNIDWSKTKAYCFGSCFVNVNLRGREPTGIVPPEEYDGVVRDIIKALQTGIESADGKTRGLAFAVPKDQAGFIGQGGDGSGDVVFGILGGEIGGYFGGVHSVQIPSAKGKNGGDMRPVCIMTGKAFKKDFILKRPTDLTDIMPTLFYALGYPQPKDATGGVVFAAYSEEDNIRTT